MLPALSLRPLTSQADYDAAIALQRTTWGDDFRELVPPAVMMIAEKTGGIAGGAFTADGTLAGFVFGISGIEDGRPIHWSHMLAVREGMRDHGIGGQLKQWQAERLAAVGITTMYWTFDPLVARNAHFNFNSLGVTVRDYVRDLYGDGATSKTDGVIGSDRLVVRWETNAETRTRGHRDAQPAPDRVSTRPRVHASTIDIPASIQDLKLVDPDRARRYRLDTRAAFEAAFAAGHTVLGFERTPEGGRYLLGPR